MTEEREKKGSLAEKRARGRPLKLKRTFLTKGVVSLIGRGMLEGKQPENNKTSKKKDLGLASARAEVPIQSALSRIEETEEDPEWPACEAMGA